MAQITPFRGIRYNPDHISSMADVTSPPYDVITEAEQAELHDRSPHNIVRLELGQKRPGDDHKIIPTRGPAVSCNMAGGRNALTGRGAGRLSDGHGI